MVDIIERYFPKQKQASVKKGGGEMESNWASTSMFVESLSAQVGLRSKSSSSSFFFSSSPTPSPSSALSFSSSPVTEKTPENLICAIGMSGDAGEMGDLPLPPGQGRGRRTSNPRPYGYSASPIQVGGKSFSRSPSSPGLYVPFNEYGAPLESQSMQEWDSPLYAAVRVILSRVEILQALLKNEASKGKKLSFSEAGKEDMPPSNDNGNAPTPVRGVSAGFKKDHPRRNVEHEMDRVLEYFQILCRTLGTELEKGCLLQPRMARGRHSLPNTASPDQPRFQQKCESPQQTIGELWQSMEAKHSEKQLKQQSPSDLRRKGMFSRRMSFEILTDQLNNHFSCSTARPSFSASTEELGGMDLGPGPGGMKRFSSELPTPTNSAAVQTNVERYMRICHNARLRMAPKFQCSDGTSRAIAHALYTCLWLHNLGDQNGNPTPHFHSYRHHHHRNSSYGQAHSTGSSPPLPIPVGSNGCLNPNGNRRIYKSPVTTPRKIFSPQKIVTKVDEFAHDESPEIPKGDGDQLGAPPLNSDTGAQCTCSSLLLNKATCLPTNPAEEASSRYQDNNPEVPLHGLIRLVYKDSDLAIMSQVKLMSTLRNPQDVIVESKFHSHLLQNPWAEAIKHANKIAWEEFSPIDKMRRLSMLESAVSEEFEKSGHTGNLSADKFMPVLVYVISQVDTNYVLLPGATTTVGPEERQYSQGNKYDALPVFFPTHTHILRANMNLDYFFPTLALSSVLLVPAVI
jgi:hypothetical protein